MCFNEVVYICSECKKIIEEIDDVYILDDSNTRGFCSKSCLDLFYLNIENFYRESEEQLREELSLENEECLELASTEDYLNENLNNPTELRKITNDLGEEQFIFILNKTDEIGPYDQVYFISIATLIDGRPGKVLFTTTTQSQKLLKYFQVGEIIPIDNFVDPQEASGTDDKVDADFFESLERKKSDILAKILEVQGEDDIPFHEHGQYEQYMGITLETPDEIYRREDLDMDSNYVYIKAHQFGSQSFYYISICLLHEINETQQEETVIPIYSFPTTSKSVLSIFRKGEKLTERVEN